MTEDTTTPPTSEPVAGPVQRPVRPLVERLRLARPMDILAQEAATEFERLRFELGYAQGQINQAESDKAKAVAAERERCANLCETWMAEAERHSGPEAAGWLHQVAQHMRNLKA